MKAYRLGLSRPGLAAVLLVLLPNLLSLFLPPPADLLGANDAPFWLWNLLENLGRFGVMAALLFVLRRTPVRRGRGLLLSAGALLLAYYVLWGLYFAGLLQDPALLGLAVCPTLFFLLVSLWGGNLPAAAFSVFFGLLHIAITASNVLC